MCPLSGENPSDNIGYILYCEIVYYILVIDYKTTASRVSYTGSRRMTISAVSRIFDSYNMGFVEIVEYYVGLSTHWAASLSSSLAVISQTIKEILR